MLPSWLQSFGRYRPWSKSPSAAKLNGTTYQRALGWVDGIEVCGAAWTPLDSVRGMPSAAFRVFVKLILLCEILTLGHDLRALLCCPWCQCHTMEWEWSVVFVGTGGNFWAIYKLKPHPASPKGRMFALQGNSDGLYVPPALHGRP